MADAIKVFDVEINTSSINEFRKSLKEARAALNETEIGTTEFTQGIRDLEAAENKLRNALKLGTTEVEKADDSYNALTRSMSELKAQWRATNDEARRNELGKQIAEINQQLKDMDASIGNYQRNVGNYEGALDAFGGSLQSLTTPIKSVNVAFKALLANPIVALFAALVAIVIKTIEVMKNSEEGFGRLTVAMSGFKAIGDVVTRVFEKLGEGLGWVIEKCTTFLGKILGLKDATEEYKKISEEELAIEKERRRVTEENSELELKISELRAKASDKLNVSAKDRIAALREAMKLEDQMMRNNLNLAVRERDLIIDKNSKTKSSTEELNKEAEAKANVNRIQAELNNKQREYNAQLKEATNEMLIQEGKKAEELAAEERIAARRREFEENAKLVDDNLKLKERENKGLMKGMTQIAKLQEKYDKEDAEQKLKAKEREKILAEAKVQFAQLGANAMQNAAQIIGEETKTGKALMIASTIMNTYASATEAYKSMAGIPYVGPALGAAAAAAAITAGMANVKQIIATDASGKSTPSISGATPSVPAVVNAPAVVQEVPVVRTLTSASEEERLNKIASNQRVYLVYSDVEEAGKHVEVQQTESSF
ncbi:MAG: hypothetical protein IKK89_04675 [Alistipes sp.]|nr:hypothetical protein [Alistipes sp.]MBR6631221.1 hypothetical protein [Alistipes sp.]